MRSVSKTTVAIVLGAILVGVFAFVAVTQGIGSPSVSDDAVAKIDEDIDDITVDDIEIIRDGEITEAGFDRALQQAAKRQGLQEPPAESDPQFELIRNEALGDLFDIAWISGEAKERGIEVTDLQVQQELATIKQQNFKTDAKYQQFLEQSGFTQGDVDLRVKLQILSGDIQEKVSSGLPEVSDSEIEEFYDENKVQFEQPEQRDIRLVLTKDEAAANEAKTQLEADPSDANWLKVAKESSTDPASKDKGGVRSAITPGVLEGEMDAAVFEAPLNTIQGPVQTPLGFYVFEVTKETPGGAQPLDQIKEQLKQQLEGQKQQEVFSAFVEDYRSKWTDLTTCAEGFEFDRCDNFTAESQIECTDEQASQTGCPPPVIGRNPISPGQGGGGVFGASGGAPQRPHPPGEGAPAPTGIPGGIPGGAVPAPPGAAP